MVGVEMGEDEQRDLGDPEGAQTAVDEAGLRAGVHHDGGAVARGEHQRVALADVAGHQPPGRRRPARHRARQRHRTHDGRHEQQRRRGAQPGTAQKAAPGRDHHHGDGGQQQGACPGAGPVDRRSGQGGTTTGHRRDPVGRPGRDPGEGLGDGHGERRRGQGREPEDGGGADREFRQQVAGDGDQADVGGQHRHHGGAHRLRGRRRGQDLREARRHPPASQSGAPARREKEERGGGQHGQHEAVRAGEPGVVEEQQEGGSAQRGQQAAAAARADGQQGDQPAGGRAQHARVRPAHDDERHREHSPEHGRHTERESQPRRQAAAFGAQGEPGRTDQQDQHQGEIGTADRGQMGQVGGLEGVVQLHRDSGRVPDDQPGKEGPGVGRQALGGLTQSRPEPAGHPLRTARRLDDAGRPADRQHRGDSVTRARRRGEPGLRVDVCPRQQRQPPASRLPGDEQDRSADGGRRTPRRHAHRLGLHQHRVRGSHRPAHLWADQPGIRGQPQLDPRMRVFGRQGGHRTAVQIRGVQPRDGRGRRRAERHSGRRRPPAYERRRRRQDDHRARPCHGSPRQCEGDARREPGRDGRCHQTQVRRAFLARVRRTPWGDGRRVHRRAGGVHGVTSGLRSENRRSPMPLTSRSCSTDVKPPCRPR